MKPRKKKMPINSRCTDCKNVISQRIALKRNLCDDCMKQRIKTAFATES